MRDQGRPLPLFSLSCRGEGSREGLTPTPNCVVVWGWLVEGDYIRINTVVGDIYYAAFHVHPVRGEANPL